MYPGQSCPNHTHCTQVLDAMTTY
uniref:Uncharacterized protein n=1 Tax=Anguilla anguilla TaxID=7936 RepID=A0A0E9VP03_ANGAN